MSLVKSMLTFNPNKRITARQCLDHQVFDDIRDPLLEFTAPFKIKVHDQDSAGFDYEDYIERLSIEECIQALQEEIKECN